jgi:uncharacterized phage-associated protein
MTRVSISRSLGIAALFHYIVDKTKAAWRVVTPRFRRWEGPYHAKRTGRAEAPSRLDQHVGDSCPHCDGRGTGQQEVGSGPLGKGRSEGARGKSDTGTALGNRPQSSKREVGMIIPSLSAARTMCEASNWSLSNLELQKLLYLAELTYVGRSDGAKSLVNENFQAWDYGPVLPSVYHRVKAFGSKRIPNVFLIAEPYSDDKKSVIEEVANTFSDWNASELVALTHRDGGAWAKHYLPGIRGIVIPRNDIVTEYTELAN